MVAVTPGMRWRPMSVRATRISPMVSSFSMTYSTSSAASCHSISSVLAPLKATENVPLKGVEPVRRTSLTTAGVVPWRLEAS